MSLKNQLKNLAYALSNEKTRTNLLLIFASIVVIVGMFIPIQEVDAAQYASISKQMWLEGNFLQIFHRDVNYLDKPPLLFWLSAISMGAFGFNAFAYKLPSVLFSVLGVIATNRLSRFWYGHQAAQYATIFYACSIGFFVFNQDVRTDTLLINLLVLSVYQLTLFRKNSNYKNLVLASLCIGLAMLAKGPLGIVFPAMAILPDAIYKKDWKFIFNPAWLLSAVIIATVLAPMLWGLYSQFDANPQAQVNGETGVSGLTFYFWTQSFGRITGDSVWATAYSNSPDPYFLTVTLLWSFLPFTPWLFNSLYHVSASLIKTRKCTEIVSLSAIILPLLALSRSGYQLNHYIYVCLPFCAILAAATFQTKHRHEQALLSNLNKAYQVIWLLLPLLLAILLGRLDNLNVLALIIATSLIYLIALTIQFKGIQLVAYFTSSSMLLVFAFFYPWLMQFQVADHMIEKYQQQASTESKLFLHGDYTSHAADFKNKEWLPFIALEEIDSLADVHKEIWVYTNKASQLDPHYWMIMDSFNHYPVTRLKPTFFIQEKRQMMLTKRYLVRYNPKKIDSAIQFLNSR